MEMAKYWKILLTSGHTAADAAHNAMEWQSIWNIGRLWVALIAETSKARF